MYVFPLAIAVGTHYAPFCTVFGDRLFWVLAGLVTAVGVLDVLATYGSQEVQLLLVGLLEIVFGILFVTRDKLARPLGTASL